MDRTRGKSLHFSKFIFLFSLWPCLLFADNQGRAGKLPPDLGSVSVENTFGWLQEAWDRAEIAPRLRIKLPKFGDQFFLDGFISYTASVEPASIDNFQLRQDIWEGRLGIGFSESPASFRTRATVSMRYGRLVATEDKAKILPIKTPREFPYKWQKALKMAPGETAQLVLTGEAGVGASESSADEFSGSVSVGANRSAQFRLEVYRKKNNQVRVRILHIRKPMVASGGIYLNPLDSVSWFDAWGVVGKPFEKLFDRIIDNCKLVVFAGNSNILDDTRPDTFAGEYILDLNNDLTRAAFDQTLNQVLSSKVLRLIDIVSIKTRMAERMTDLLSPIDDIYEKSSRQPELMGLVTRNFLGRGLTDYANSEVGTKCASSLFYNLTLNTSRSVTDLVEVDKEGKTNNYIYLASSRDFLFNFFFRVFQERDSRRVNGLFLAKAASEKFGATTTPEEIQDILIIRNLSDKNMSSEDIRYFKNLIDYTDPRIGASINWDNFTNGRNKKNAYLRYQYIFHQATFDALPRLNERQIYDLFRALIESHPDKSRIPTNTPVTNGQGRSGHIKARLLDDEKQLVISNMVAANERYYEAKGDRFESDLRDLAYLWDLSLNAKDPKVQLDAFESMAIYDLFHEIGPAFVVRLLPPEDLRKYVRFEISGGARDETSVNGSFGNEPLSPLFTLVQYMLRVINNQSIDIQFMVDEADLTPHN